MMHPSKLNKIWLILGVIFIGLGGYNLFVHGHVSSLLTIAIGALVVYTSVYNMGGWRAAAYDLGLGGLFKTPGLKKIQRGKRKPWQ